MQHMHIHPLRAPASGFIQHQEKTTSSHSLCRYDQEEAAPASRERLGFRRGGTSLLLSLDFVLPFSPPLIAVHLLLLSPRLEKAGDGDGGEHGENKVG